MEDIKRRFANEIAAKLSGAPESDAKSEMIEELAENLSRRYEDMTGGGMGGDEAFARAMDELGNVYELEAYLNSLEPEGDAREGEGPRDDVDGLFQTIKDIGRTVGDMAKEAAGMAGDFFRSDDVRAAVKEGKRAVRSAGEAIRSMADRDWDGAAVRVHVDGDGTVRGKAESFGWKSGAVTGRSFPSEGVLRLDVETAGGDVDVLLDDDAAAPILAEGNMDRLDVAVTEDGVLTVRPRSTASNQFFSFRGAFSRDLRLTVPARRWESVRIVTSSGDVDIDDLDTGRGLEVDRLTVQTVSGDVDCRLKGCQRAAVKTVSGDVDIEGDAAEVLVETASGDVELDGPMGQAEAVSASGDVDLTGSVWKARLKSMSGDVRVESMTLPAEMELSSKSGDVSARIPDSGPFRVRASSVSGTVDLRPFEQWSWSGTADPNAPAPQYSLATISGDVALEKY